MFSQRAPVYDWLDTGNYLPYILAKFPPLQASETWPRLGVPLAEVGRVCPRSNRPLQSRTFGLRSRSSFCSHNLSIV